MSSTMTTSEIPIGELPTWMRQARQGIDWGLMIVLSLCLMAALSFLASPELPHTNASENYVFRAADYATALREGRIYPRWAANALGGYGAPIPSFYPPAAGYITAVLTVLFTDDPVLAVRLVFAAALCVAGGATYTLTARRAGAAAGILAGMLYVYSPYVGLVAPHILGDLPGVMSLALIPALLWRIDRLLTVNRPSDFALAMLVTTALCVTNIRGTAAGLGLAAGLIIWQQTAQERRSWPRAVVAILVGLGMAAFYWIPALLEQEAIRWEVSTALDYPLRLTLAELFAPLRQIDSGALIAKPQLTIGIINLIFAGAGGIYALKTQRHFQLLFFTLGLGLLTTSVILLPTQTWLLGPIALCLAITGSAILGVRDHLWRRRQRRLFLPALAITIWIGSSPVWLSPGTQDPFGSVAAATQVQYEHQGYGTAILPPGDPMPSTLATTTPQNRALIDSYQTQTVNKLTPGQQSLALQISPLEHLSHSDRFQVRRVETPTTLHILTSYFPGWHAALAGNPILVSRNPSTGLLGVELPTLRGGGNNELVIWLDTTPVRTGAWIISGAVFLLMVTLTWGRARRPRRASYEERDSLSRAELRLMSMLLACFALILITFANPVFPISLRSSPGYELSGSVFTRSRTDAGLGILAFRLENNQFGGGETVNLTIYWQAQRFLTENYRVRVSLVNNQDGGRWSASELRHPGYYPTGRWNSQQYIRDDYALAVPVGMTAGNYRIVVEAYRCNPNCTTEGRLTFFGSTGQSLGPEFTLPTLINVQD